MNNNNFPQKHIIGIGANNIPMKKTLAQRIKIIEETQSDLQPLSPRQQISQSQIIMGGKQQPTQGPNSSILMQQEQKYNMPTPQLQKKPSVQNKPQYLNFHELNYHQGSLNNILAPQQQLKIKRRYKLTYDCRICYERNDKNTVFSSCGHSFHKECLKFYVADAIQNCMNLRCPSDGCGAEITQKIIRSILDMENLAKYQRFLLRCIVGRQENKNLIACNGCDYIALMPQRLNRKGFCQKCKIYLCLKCKKGGHGILTCDEAEAARDPNKNEAAFQNLVVQQQVKKCPKCSAYVSRTEGCNHMTCICKFEFCYKCNRTYKDPACKCPVFDRQE